MKQLKIPFLNRSVGSSPPARTNLKILARLAPGHIQVPNCLTDLARRAH